MIRKVDGHDGKYHSYVTSQVKFIVLDARSFKNVTQNYGPEQIEWLKKELIEAQNDGKIRGVVLVHSWPWFS